ncbi:MAG: ABATE domain-containing protein [Ktedonobacteraceae bacterium]|nr:ABATE domain-containing protein [Ktedonobacteraceae bacterium]
MSIEERQESDLPHRLSGHLGLDFVNTIDPRHAEHTHEFLTNYAALVAWGKHVELLPVDHADQLLQAAEQRPAIANAAFHRALGLREALYAIFSANIGGQRPSIEDMNILNGVLREGMARASVHITEQGFAWTWEEESALDSLLWPIARSAAELLSSDEVQQVRECPGDDGCGWLFIDTSRNHRRRWCSMDGCGNRAKARRHYGRKNTAKASSHS